MRTLITGGAGFIGSNLAAYLTRTGHEVTVLDNLQSGCLANLAPLPSVRFIQGDIRDVNVVERAVQGAEVIFHMAASVGNKRSIDFPVDDAEINVTGTLRVLEAARKFGVRKVVFSSSAGIFGELKTLPIREDHPIAPQSPYGATKLCAEKQCLAYAWLYGFEAVSLRYFNVYGPNQRFDAYGNVIPIFVFRMLRGEPVTIFGDGRQTRDFVNVAEVVQANVLAATPGVQGPFNIGSGLSISINDLVFTLQGIVGVNGIVNRSAERPGDVRDSLADISAARAAFGFKPSVTIADGLREYVKWARSLGSAAGSGAGGY